MAEFHDPLSSQQVNVAVAAYLEAVERGTPPDREAFLAQHVDIASELREFLDDYQSVNRVIPGQHSHASTNDNARSTGGRRLVAPSLLLPRVFGDFELLEELARGGMGVVYKARQKNPDRIVALKMILAGQLASQADVDRFSAEAHAAASLDHPHIVPIFEVGQHEGQHYFTMGYVAGESLAQRLILGPVPAREAAMIIADVAVAVNYSHERGIIHRDLKPANILLDSDGRVRVTDFGLAKRQTDESGLTRTGQLLGTPSFMSPEQVAQETSAVGPASDVYSLGATLYAIVTGRPPFLGATTVETLRQVLDRDPLPPRELNAELPRDLETIVLMALTKDPCKRYSTAAAMADDLHRYLDDRPILARRSTQRERLMRWCRRNPALALLTATAAVTLLAGTTISTWQALRAERAERKAENLVVGLNSDDPDALVQGEYLGAGQWHDKQSSIGAHVVARGDKHYSVVVYAGGLPGEGWDGATKDEALASLVDGAIAFQSDWGSGDIRAGTLRASFPGEVTAELKRVMRSSATAGAKPPPGAIVLFDGTSTHEFSNAQATPSHLLLPGATSKRSFRNCLLHVEFVLPFMPGRRGDKRSNSGVYLQGRYEVQIVDSFALVPGKYGCGAVFGVKPPSVNVCFPPLAWQTYDIEFTAAKFEDGAKVQDAVITVRHNGHLIQDHVPIPRATIQAPSPEGADPGPIYLQGYGDPVCYRNIWIMELP